MNYYKDIILKNREVELVLTSLQQHWLNTYGGRDAGDVCIKNNKFYIILTYKNEDYFREVPSHKEIKKNIRKYISDGYIKNNYVYTN